MREIRPSGSMSGRWKQGMGCGTEPRRGNPDTWRSRPLNHCATARLYSEAHNDGSMSYLVKSFVRRIVWQM
jgi:hypothetical protein